MAHTELSARLLAYLIGASTLALSGCAVRSDLVVDGDPVVRVLRRDAIPAIDRPEMISVAEVGDLLADSDTVLGVYDGVSARAYPPWQLDGHEIVNDRLGQLPIAATW